MKERYKEREEYIWRNMNTKDGDIIFLDASTDSILTILCIIGSWVWG